MSLWRKRVWVFLGVFGASALLTCLALSSLLSQNEGESRAHWLGQVALNTAATILGPFVGGFSRDWQSCCARNSLSLFPYGAGVLAAGIALQLVPLPAGPWWERARLFAWGLGWLGWFGAGFVSLAHALE